MTPRTEDRRKHLSTYLNMTVEDLVERGVVRRGDPIASIAKAVFAELMKDFSLDIKTVVAGYAREKTALALSLGAMTLGAKSGDSDFAELLNTGARMLSKRIMGGGR